MNPPYEPMLNRQDVRNIPCQRDDRKVGRATPGRGSVLVVRELLVFHRGLLGAARLALVALRRYLAAWRGQTHLVPTFTVVAALAQLTRVGLFQGSHLVSKIHERGANSAPMDQRILCADPRTLLSGHGLGLGRFFESVLADRWCIRPMVGLDHGKKCQSKWHSIEVPRWKFQSH